MVKSNNEIGKVNDKKNLIQKSNNEIGKKVLTDGLDHCLGAPKSPNLT